MVDYRLANEDDAHAIAELHTDSWRRNYRGAYADAYLDGDLLADRLAVWTERLLPDDFRVTIVAEDDGSLAGFAHTVLDADETWGALLDNLHVEHGLKRRGIGAGLVTATAEAVVHRCPGSRLHLWVLEQNRSAQAFYEALGGERVEARPVDPPGGDPSRLAGSPMCVRYAWREPAQLRRREAG